MAIYLDNASTTMVCPEAANAAMEAMVKSYGNPSSTHRMGREAKKLLQKSRAQVADALYAAPEEIYFTSGGTESDNWALLCAARYIRRRGNHIISSLAEHDAVLKCLDILENEGFSVTRLAPDSTGKISPDAVKDALTPETILVSLMMVNNETGAVTDIPAIGKIIKDENSEILFHCDAVQGFLKLPFKTKELNADLISISAHKVHGMKGCGALYIKKSLHLPPFISGGGQESGRRSGTEGLPQIAAFGEASEVGYRALSKSAAKMHSLKDEIASSLRESIPCLVITPGDAPHILSIAIPGYKSEVMMNYLESKGIYVSKSSACKKGGRSHVLEAIGLDAKTIDGAIRIGLSRFTTSQEAEDFSKTLIEAYQNLLPSL